MKLFLGSLATAASIGLVFMQFAPVSADDWNQWRGPTRDAKSSEKGLASKWSEQGPKMLWRTPDLGSGYSTPSVSDGLVCLMTNVGMTTDQVVALNAKDGTVKWKKKVGAVGANRGPQYPGSRSTPTIEAGRVYALGSDGDLVSLDAKNGDLVWHKSLRTDFNGAAGMWAYTESPLIDGDALICSPGGAKSTVVALNKRDGSVIWQSPLAEADEASYSSPIVTEINGQKQYVLFLSKGVVGLNAADGKLAWRYSKTSDQAANVQTPIVRGKYVYTGAGRVGGSLAEVSQGSEVAKQIYFDRAMPTGMGGAVLVGDYLYGSSGETLICVEFETGKLMWRERGIGASSICYADGKLFLHGENNMIAMVEATPDSYKELGRAKPADGPDRGNSKAWTHPIIADGKLIIHDAGTVWCFDLK